MPDLNEYIVTVVLHTQAESFDDAASKMHDFYNSIGSVAAEIEQIDAYGNTIAIAYREVPR